MADEAKKSVNRVRITFNAPIVLGFVIACCAVMAISKLSNGGSDRLLFSVYRSSLKNGFTYVRFLGHVFGHSNLDHLVENMTMILLLGPMLEEKYGTKSLAIVIALTALTTGIVHFILFPGAALMGASGVVFAFIILSSITGDGKGGIPITFLIVALIYIGRQIYDGVTLTDNISQLTHIIGGIVGAIIGFASRKG